MSTHRASILLARIALFTVYFWFGLLKVIDLSPASPMVEHLLSVTMPFFPFSIFIVLFGLYEMLIGILFAIPGKEKPAVILFFLHMLTTSLPLFCLGGEVWTGILTPTLEGQYIIKNLALIACALVIWSTVSPYIYKSSKLE